MRRSLTSDVYVICHSLHVRARAAWCEAASEPVRVLSTQSRSDVALLLHLSVSVPRARRVHCRVSLLLRIFLRLSQAAVFAH